MTEYQARSGNSRVLPGKKVSAITSLEKPETGAPTRVLHAIAVGPWVKPELHFSSKPLPRSAESDALLAEAQAQFEEESRKAIAEGKPPQDLSDYPGIARISIRVGKVKGKTVVLHGEPGNFAPFILNRRQLDKIPPKKKRRLLKSGRLDELFRHVLPAGAGVLSIGGKYIVIPRRGEKMTSFPSMYHVVSGFADFYHLTDTERRHELPHETALREVAEEVGLPGAAGNTKRVPWFQIDAVAAATKRGVIRFYGPGFKFQWPQRAQALTIVRHLRNATVEPLYAMDIKTRDPDKLIREKFKRNKDGTFDIRDAPDRWEMQYAAIIPRTPEAIAKFLVENKGKISPHALVALVTYLEELKKVAA